MSLLFSKTRLGSLELNNRLVMAPLTRSRATGNVPNELMAEYYAQRGSVGLIITEGTAPSPNGLGYVHIPGIFSAEQIAGWKRVTEAVRPEGAKMFMQIMHCGRIAHGLNLPAGGRVLAPSPVAAEGELFTLTAGMQPNALPEEMSAADLAATREEYVQAAKNAIAAGMNGVELHAANGYLLEQFLRPNSNQRTDAYGGPIENRARFVLEVAEAVCTAIGKDRVGIRLSPFGVFNDMPAYPELEADYTWLAERLNALGLVYVHLVDHSPMGAPAVPDSIKATFRRLFKGSLILSGGYDALRAESDLETGKADLIAVGRPLISNPDLLARWKSGAALNAPDFNTFYIGGAAGYTDYPKLG